MRQVPARDPQAFAGKAHSAIMNKEICLRRLTEEDIPGMLEWMHDPEINRWFQFDPDSINEESARRFIENSFTETQRHYAVSDESGIYYGTASLHEIDLKNGHGTYSAGLRSCAVGSGAGTAALRIILRVAFEELGLKRVISNVLSDNLRSQKMLEKCGMRYEGCFRSHVKKDGVWRDLYWFAILREEYEAGKQ